VESRANSLTNQSGQAQKLIAKDAELLTRCHGHAKQLKKRLTEEFTKQVVMLKAENRNLTDQVGALKRKFDHELEQEQAFKANATNQLKTIQHQKLKLSDQLELMRQNLSAEADLVLKTQKMNKDLEAKEKSIVGALTSTKADAEALTKDSAKYVAMKKKKHELAKKREKAFKEELGSLRVANRTLSKQAKVLEEKLKQANSSRHALAEEAKALQKKLKEEKHVEENIKKHEKALEENFTKQLHSLRNATEAIKVNATAKADAMQRKLADKEKAMLAKNKALQSESAALEMQIKQLQKGYLEKYADMENTNKGLFSAKQEMEAKLKSAETKLASEVQQEKSKEDAYQKKLDDKTKEADHEKTQTKAVTEKLSKLDKEAALHETSTKQLQEQLEQLKKKVQNAEAKTSSLAKTRRVLSAAVFSALDTNANGHLNAEELSIFGKLTGFQGDSDEWQKEFGTLCTDRGADPEKGFTEAQFQAMVDDENEASTHCTDEELAELLGKVSVAAVKPEVLALIHPGKAVTKKASPKAPGISNLQLSKGNEDLTADDLEDLEDAEAA